MFQWVRRLFSVKPPSGERTIRAAYDLEKTTDDNREHWRRVDGLSARGANSLDVRKKLRERSRYATHEGNSYAKGICETVANDLIGTGPRLQINTADRALNKAIETAWSAWAKAVGLADELHTAAKAKFTDGEAFFVLGTNAGNDNQVKLFPRLIECDQCTTPALLWSQSLEQNAVDGIVFEPKEKGGNPKEYHFLKDHPGDLLSWAQDYETVPAKDVIHWFRKDRPGQARGVPEMTTGITPLEELRRFVLAVLAASEAQADIPIVIKTQQSPNIEPDIDSASDFDALPIRRRTMVRLPAGHDVGSVPNTQPNDTFKELKRETLSEAGRCTNMPYGMIAGDSSDSSYAGGRLEVQGWQLALRVTRANCERVVMWRIFAAWYYEARLIPGLLPANAPKTANELPLRWFWDSRPHVDPAKEATADEKAIACRTKSRTEIAAERGVDWEDEVLPKLIAEEAALKAAGLATEAKPAAKQPQRDALDNEQEVAQQEAA